MSKKTIDGKRFSRREKITPRDEGGLAEHLKTIGRPNGKGGYTVGYSFPERLARIKQSAEALLQGKGLPTAPAVWWAGNEPKPRPSEIRADFPVPTEQAAQGFSRCDLLHYVEKIAGHKKDSPEWLCAKIIDLMSRIESGQGERRDAALFELAEVYALAKVYAAESAAGAKHNPREKKAWAMRYAEMVRDERVSKDECWNRIPTGRDRPDEVDIDGVTWEVYRDGDKLVASIARQRQWMAITGQRFSSEELAKSTFLGYMKKPREKA